MKIKVAYIISDIDKALAFEWIATRMDKEKFQLFFILLNPADSILEQFLKQNKIPVCRVLCRGKKDWIQAWFKIISFLKRQSIDAVHCHLFTASILGLSAAWVAGVKTRIYTRHHSDYHFRYFPKGVKWDKFCNKLATQIIAPSRTVKRVLTEREGVLPEKVSIIHHGFDLEYFKNVPDHLKQKLQEQYNPKKQYPVIGVISRFTQLKGIQYIIPAFEKLLNQYPDALLLLFNAQGDYKNEIELLLSQLPDKNYKTIVFEKELAAVYSLFDVFVQASTDTTIESFGQTYIEALMAGVPSVFTLAGVAGEFIVDGENALVVPFKDSDAIHEKLLTLIESIDIAQQMAVKGKASVESLFSINEMVTRYSELYRN